MKNTEHSRSSLFLMELVLALLFFSICAAVCLRLFAAARTAAEESRRLDGAVLAVESAAACWKTSGGDIEKTAALLGAELNEGGVLTLSLAEDWSPAAAGESVAYLLTLTEAEEEPFLRRARVELEAESGESVYRLDIAAARGGDGP